MDVHIDRLRLRVAGIGEDSARQLAGLIGQRLNAAVSSIPVPGRLARLDVTVAARAGDGLDDLADAAAAEVLRAVSASGPQDGASG